MARGFASGRPAKWNEKPPRMRLHWPIGARARARMVAVNSSVSRGALTAPTAKGRPSSESLPHFYSAPGGDIAHDGRDSAGRHGRLFSVAGLGFAAGRLSYHSDPDFLSGRQSGSDDFGGYSAAGEAVRAGAWTEPDDLHQ